MDKQKTVKTPSARAAEKIAHTPGPWKFRQAYTKGEPCGIVIDAGRETICETMTNDEIGEANARLIASAPELLKACKEMNAATLAGGPYDIDKASVRIRAAIAKVEGK